MTQKNVALNQFLNDARLSSGCGSEGNFGLSSGAGLSCGVFGLSSGSGLTGGFGLSAGPGSSAHSLCLMERVMSRGGVMLDGGRRYAAAATLATAVGIAVIPDAYALDVGLGQTSTGLTAIAGSNTPMNVFSGGVASSTTVSNGGTQYVYDNGSAGGTTINDGGHAIGTDISDGDITGWQSVFSGGIASATNVYSGGQQVVYYNGVASDTNITVPEAGKSSLPMVPPSARPSAEAINTSPPAAQRSTPL